jgi:phosphatidylserine decarboxylase
MALPLNDWKNSEEFKFYDSLDPAEIGQIYFHRDPQRPKIIDSSVFYAPADGIILYQKEVNDKNRDLIEVKGQMFTLDDLLFNSVDVKKAIVTGIFMTFYDVHINRMPTKGFISRYDLPPIMTANLPMLSVEKNLFTKKRDRNNIDYRYLFANERVLNTVYVPEWDYKYYIIQMADEDVDCIVSYYPDEGQYYLQGDRFGCIRYGSQCDLILPLPLPENWNYDFLLQPEYHVKAGIDPLIRIYRFGEEEYYYDDKDFEELEEIDKQQ